MTEQQQHEPAPEAPNKALACANESVQSANWRGPLDGLEGYSEDTLSALLDA